MALSRLTTLFLSSLVLFQTNFSNACTDFRLTAQDGTVLVTRSLEFGIDLKSNLISSPRGTAFASKTPNGKDGLIWKSKYGYLLVDGLNMGIAADGINEKGLSFEYLYLPGDTTYQTVPVGKDNQAIPYYYFGDWILGNFSTVDEVKQALTTIYVFSQKMPNGPDIIFPVHAAIYDSSGKSIVVEFVNGKMHIHDNNVGVLTNSPTYDWQISNLRNYVYLSPYTPNPVTINGIMFPVTGQGAGAHGLPGDVSPPSRFVKTNYLIKTAMPAKDANSLLNLAQHIINNFDIPYGLARAKDSSGKDKMESTQWVVFKDLTHKVFYYRTYSDLTLHAVALNQVDFSEGAEKRKMLLVNNQVVLDMTKQFNQSQ